MKSKLPRIYKYVPCKPNYGFQFLEFGSRKARKTLIVQRRCARVGLEMMHGGAWRHVRRLVMSELSYIDRSIPCKCDFGMMFSKISYSEGLEALIVAVMHGRTSRLFRKHVNCSIRLIKEFNAKTSKRKL